MMSDDERVVVTGIGAIAAVGVGTAAYWEAVVKGTPGLDRITRFDPAGAPCQVAGEARGFDPVDYIDHRLIAQTDRWTQFGLAAADMAFTDAAYDPADFDPYRTSVITASAGGGNEFGQREIGRLWAEGPRSVGPYQSIAWFYAATTGQVAIHRGVKGPCGVVVSDGASGLDAIGRGRRLLRRGAADAVLTGGTEAPVSPYALACQNRSGRLSSGADPETAYAPFTSLARGQVPGEGGAMLLLETMGSARRRAAPHVYAEIAGYSASHDGQPSGTAPDGEQLARTIRAAVSSAGLEPDDIDAVFADGAATLELDQAEAAALGAVFGPRPVPVTVPKTMTGWLYSGGAALDVAAAALALDRAVLPPTVGPVALAPACPLNIIRRAAPMLLRHVLVVARGYGGFNAAMVVSHPLVSL